MHCLIFGYSCAQLAAPVLLLGLTLYFLIKKKASVRGNADDADTSTHDSMIVPTETNSVGCSSSPTETNNNTSSSLMVSTGNCYEVFLSFRGLDTRHGFTDHLYHGLFEAGILTFRDDDELCQGEDIRPELMAAITNSKILIPIVSVNYGASSWCLDELVQIMERKNNNGQIVMPIFYKVKPSDVGHLIGSFGEAFHQHEKRLLKKSSFDPTILKKWKEALLEVSSLKGYEAERFEVELGQSVVRKVLIELKKKFELIVSENLVKIDSHVKKVVELLEDESHAVLSIGIHGMGGIGKTTLAKTIYNKLSNKFEHRSFIADIRESWKHGAHDLQNQLISDILNQKVKVHNKDEGINFISSRFKDKKVLILLDDVDNVDQVKCLVGKHDWFSLGSRIIITTINKRILELVGVDHNFDFTELDPDQSSIPFSKHAFRKDFPPSEFEGLTGEVVSTTGLPLSSEVLGSLSCGKELKRQRVIIKNLKKVPLIEVQEKLNAEDITIEMKAKDDCATDHLVEIDSQVEALMDLLDYDFGCARFLGIYGPAGIGKTTLAKALFDKLISNFNWYYFLPDVRESSCRHGLVFLQNKLLSSILYETEPTADIDHIDYGMPMDDINDIDDGVKLIREKLHDKKVLIVLDDVDHREQLAKLIGKISWFARGSRVIITTRNKSILECGEKIVLYELGELNYNQALQLYISHAFKRESPRDDYYESLSGDIISTIGGLPLVVEVIGSFLHWKHKTVWKDTLEKLRSIAHGDVHQQLKISYDALNFKQKQIFLDIACFSSHTEEINVSYMWKDCNSFPQIEIEVLSSLSLINIRENGGLWMHDLLKDLGRQIVHEENRDPRKHSRLWIPEEAVDIVKTKENKGNIEALSLAGDPTMLIFTDEDFARLPNLRFLELDGGSFIGDFTYLFSKLKWFSWCHCPPDLIATNLFPQNLVVLRLSEFCDANDWKGWSQIKMLHNLKVLELTRLNMVRIDLLGCFTLEILIIKECRHLVQIDCSIGELKRLAYLNIEGCNQLKDLPGEIGQLLKLKHLSFSGCSNLMELPVLMGKLNSLIKLDLSYTSIEGLPCSIGYLANLKYLYLAGCRGIRELPYLIRNLESLVELDLSHSGIEVLPHHIGNQETLNMIRMEDYRLAEFPSAIRLPMKLEVLRARCCSIVGEVSSEIGKSSFLRILDLSYTHIRRVPETIAALPHLEELILRFCDQLQELPPLPTSLTHLLVSSRSLQSIPDLSNLTNLVILLLSDGCEYSWWSSSIRFETHNLGWIGKLSKLESLELCLPDITASPTTFGSLFRLRKLYLSGHLYQKFLLQPPKSAMQGNTSSITTLSGLSNLRNLMILKLHRSLEKEIQLDGLEQLGHFTVSGFQLLETIIFSPSGLKNLKELELDDCPDLREIHGLGALETLESLKVHSCPSILSLIDLSKLQKLVGLEITHCNKLQGFEGLDELGCLSLFKVDSCLSLVFWTNPSDTNIPDECQVEIQCCPRLVETPWVGMFYKDYKDKILGQIKSDSHTCTSNSKGKVAKTGEKRQVATIEKFVGTDDQVNHIMGLMNINDKDKRIVVVIHGEDGIGKTTLAKLIYNRVSCDFDGCSFLGDIKEKSQVLGGLQLLQTKLISDVLKWGLRDVTFVNREIEFFRDIFCDMRVLIILDDVENAFHFHKLIGDCFDCFASGSRIIITTRNSIVLEDSPQIQTYHVSRLDNDQALQLFRHHSSTLTSPSHSNLKLSDRAFAAMAGLPLFIEVMAAVFEGKTKKERINLLKRLFEQRDFQSLLEGGLDDQQKQRFLDIACFTAGIDSQIAWYLWHDTTFLPCEILTPLATTGERNRIWMHSMLRQLGREIVRAENLTNPGKRSRLFNHEIALDTIKRKKGTEIVEALCLNFQWHTSDKLTPEDFESMPNIRFLQLDHADIAGDFADIFPNLRWLRWQGCPQHLQVTNFHLGNLTILDLSWSKVTKDWEGWDQIKMQNLKVLDLTGCADLLVTPKFSGCQNLAILILEQCSQLVKIDPSIGDLQYLVSLNLNFCTELNMLPVEVGQLTTLEDLLMDGTLVQEIPVSIGHLKQLKTLTASNCFSLSELPRTIWHLTNIILLSLDGTKIAALPDSMGELVRLKRLLLRNCRRIRKLPNSIGNIGRSLVELDVSGTGISKFPDSINNLQNLKVLRMDSCFFRELPPDIGELTSLEEIHASWCRSLEGGIPSEIGKLHNLRILRLRHSSISSIPAEIHQLSNLRTLDLLHCDMIKELPRLPSSIMALYIDDELKLLHFPLEVNGSGMGRFSPWNLKLNRMWNREPTHSNLEPDRIGLVPNSLNLKPTHPVLEPNRAGSVLGLWNRVEPDRVEPTSPVLFKGRT